MLVDAALRYAARGWPVFPCQARGKVPATAHGLSDASVDPGRIERWWRLTPDANVAIRTGAVAGLAVLDVDGEEGSAGLRQLERDHGPLPRTASVVTPGGGQHFYFAHSGVPIASSAGRLAAGVDTRGEGGYVIAPPSIGATGRRYEPDERAPLAPVPGWLLELLGGQQPMGERPAAPRDAWLSMLRDGLAEGQRNSELTRLVGYLLRRYVDVDVVAELAHLVNAHRCRPPLDASEVDRVVDSIAIREVRRRRAVGR